jgi:hypothetical protein
LVCVTQLIGRVLYYTIWYSLGYMAIQFLTAQYMGVWLYGQYGLVRYSTVQCGKVRYSAVQCCKVQYSAVQCSKVRYSAVKCIKVR